MNTSYVDGPNKAQNIIIIIIIINVVIRIVGLINIPYMYKIFVMMMKRGDKNFVILYCLRNIFTKNVLLIFCFFFCFFYVIYLLQQNKTKFELELC